MSSSPADDASGLRPAAASVRTPLKRFTHSQIAEKVKERLAVPEYEQLLMSCAVQQDDSGVVFDSTAAGWKELVRRCEQADRDSERRRKERAAAQHTTTTTTTTTAAAAGRSHSPAAAPNSSHASAAASPSAASSSSTASSLLHKLSAAMSSRSTDSGEDGGSEAKEDSVTGTTASGMKPSAVRGKVAVPHRGTAAARVRRGSQPTAVPATQAGTSNIAQPVATADSDTEQHRGAKRASAASLHTAFAAANSTNAANSLILGAEETQASPSPAVATTDTMATTATAVANHSDSRRIRPVRMLHSAAHRTNADRIKRSANKQVRDAQQLQADLAFEQRLADEVDGKYSNQQLSAEWTDRKQRENEREAERKRREEEEEKQRVAAGGRRKRKLVIPAAGLVSLPSSGEPIDELDYMSALVQQLSEPDDSRVDWRLTGQLASVTGLPHQQRMRVWTVMLQRSAATKDQQSQQSDDRREVEVADAELEAAIGVLTLSAEAANDSLAASPPSEFDSAPLPSSSLPSPKLDLINQRTVRVDIDRTLPHFARMQRQDVKHDMEVILTAYEHNTASHGTVQHKPAPTPLIRLRHSRATSHRSAPPC